MTKIFGGCLASYVIALWSIYSLIKQIWVRSLIIWAFLTLFQISSESQNDLKTIPQIQVLTHDSIKLVKLWILLSNHLIIWNILIDCNSLLFFNNNSIVLQRRTTINITGMHWIQGFTFIHKLNINQPELPRIVRY